MKFNISNKEKILVISNDAGATEYISHLLLNENAHEWNVFALRNSLASVIFDKYNIEFSLLKKLDELYAVVEKNKPGIIFYGTGWQADFSSIVKGICDKYTIKSIALIDHWVNYKERFKKDSLPDTILVMDDIANNIAVKEFDSSVNIVQTKNYFIENIQSNYRNILNKKLNKIVFISEPTTRDKMDITAYEYSVVEKLLHKYDDMIIRLHPTENIDKYNHIISKFSNSKVLVLSSYDEELVDTLSKSKLTIGFGSMALYISYLLGIDTISYMANRDFKPSIPIPSEYMLRDLNDLDNLNFIKPEQDLNSNAIEFETVIKNTLGVV